jgi:molybdopterin-guanine dinucleotide biosynthesis protein A
MREAGFVLAGGRSSRMGHDKALLRHWGVPLVVRAAAAVADVVGSVTILGDPDIYGHFGWLALHRVPARL